MHGLLEQGYGHTDTMDARCSGDYQQHAALLAGNYEYPEAIPNGSSWQYVADETARGLVQSVPPEKCDYSQLYHQYPYISSADRVTTWLSATEAGLGSQFMTVPDYSECGNLYLHSPESESSGASRCGDHKKKRKRVQTPSQRKAANVRERRRMFHLNEAFDDLRKRLPAFNYEKRLSRIETLRLAITYISFMEDLIDGKEPSNINLKSCKSRDLNALFNNVLSVGEDQHDDDVDCDDDEDMNI